jgi:hypothetical protein
MANTVEFDQDSVFAYFFCSLDETLGLRNRDYIVGCSVD